MKKEDVMYNVFSDVGTISHTPAGWCKKVRIMSWSGNRPTMDIREWDPKGVQYSSSGISLQMPEMNKLIKLYLKWRATNDSLDSIFDAKPVKKAKMHTVYENLGSLTTCYNRGYRKELTIMSWERGPAVFDISSWQKDLSKKGKGISLTLDEMDILIKMLINHRDGDKKGSDIKMHDATELECEPHQTKKLLCTFKAGEAIEVIAQTSVVDGKTSACAYVHSYAGSEALVDFLPSTLESRILPKAEKLLVSAKKAAPKSMPKGSVKAENPSKTKYPTSNFSEEIVNDPHLAKNFHERMEVARIRAGLSRGAAAKAIGVCISTVWNWERENFAIPSTSNIEKAAHVYRVFPSWLRTGKGGIDAADQERLKLEAVMKRCRKEEAAVKAKESKEAAPASSVSATPKAPAKKTAKADSSRHQLQLVNDCIFELAKSSSAEVRMMHKVLADMRTNLESKMLFGESEKSSTNNGWSSANNEELTAINGIICFLKETDFSSDEVDDLYLMLNEKRFDLEIAMLHA